MKYIYVLALICSLFFSCREKKDKLYEAPPTNQSLVAEHFPLKFNIFYPTAELENWLNRKLEGVIMDKYIKRNNDSVRVVLTKSGKIGLYPIGDSVDVSFPIRIEIDADKEKKSGKIKKRRIEAEIEIFLNIKPDVNKEWNIISKSVLKDHRWLKEPKLEIGNSKIGIKFIIDHILKKEINSLTESLDKALEEKVNLKRGINRTWLNLQKPMPIGKPDSVQLYFKVDPKLVSGDIKVTNTGFRFEMLVHTRALVHSNADSINYSHALPPFSSLKKATEDSNKLDVLAKLPLTFINHELSPIVKGYSYKNLLLKLKIEDIKLRGSGNNIVLDLEVSGSTNGRVVLVGRPYFDNKTQTLSIKDLNYELDTDQIVVNILDKNLRKDLIKYVTQNVSLELGKHIDDMPKYLNESINQGSTSEKFSLNFQDIDLEDINYAITKTDLEILIRFKPKFDLSLKRLPVRKKLKIR